MKKSLLSVFSIISIFRISLINAVEQEFVQPGVFENIMIQVAARNRPMDTLEKVINTIKELWELRRVCRTFRARLTPKFIGQFIYDAGLDLDVINGALRDIVEFGQADYLRMLIEIPGVDADEVGYALLDATRFEHIECLRVLLAIPGININFYDADEYRGFTALQIAAANGSTEYVGALLAAGANVNIADIFGRTALHFAVLYGRREAAQILVNYYVENGIAISQRLIPRIEALDIVIPTN